LVAGLGVGGVAIALASKESIENLLGSFTIFFDKPFAVGDVITLGGVTGMVEKVGFRSTRIRTYDKSIVTVPNKNIINTELDNLGVRPVRRVKFNIGLTYDTSIEQIKNIVDDIQKLVDDHPMTNEDGRVRFLNFGASSLDIMVLYYVNSPDWEDLIDTQQKINYSIIEIVNKHNSDFAVGDIITLGSTTGLVEKVGFRSTRLRTFDKSIVTVPNKNLVNAELDNLGLRPVRRVKTNIGLIYSTPVEQIKNIVNDIQQLIDDHKQTTQDGKVRFLNFGDSSLDVMVLYFVNSPDWNILVDTQQEINFKIIEIVKKHQSDFAYPTTSVFLENQKS
jgi:small-conductance mechanosensitive channel